VSGGEKKGARACEVEGRKRARLWVEPKGKGKGGLSAPAPEMPRGMIYLEKRKIDMPARFTYQRQRKKREKKRREELSSSEPREKNQPP